MLASKALTAAPMVLYPVELTVEPRIEQERPPLSPASESACFESRPVPIGLQLHSARHRANTADWKHALPSDWSPGCQSGNEERALC